MTLRAMLISVNSFRQGVSCSRRFKQFEVFRPHIKIRPSTKTADWCGPVITFNEDSLSLFTCTRYTPLGLMSSLELWKSSHMGNPSAILPHAKTLPLLQTAKLWDLAKLMSTMCEFESSLTSTGWDIFWHCSCVKPIPSFPCLFEPTINRKPSLVINAVLLTPHTNLEIYTLNEWLVSSAIS